MKKIFQRILVVLFALWGIGCQKDTLTKDILTRDSSKTSSGTGKFIVKNIDDINSVRSAFAQTLAIALRDEDLRKYIHARMQEQLKTQTEMVYIAEKNKVVSGKKTMAQILTGYAAPEVLKKFGDNFFITLTDIDPLLTIAMPETDKWNASNWNINYIPNVAAILDATSSSKQDVKTFSESGRQTTQLRDIDPNDPTLTVWEAEVTYLLNTDGFSPFGEDIDEVMPSLPPDPVGGPPTGAPCEGIYTSAMQLLNYYNIGGGTYYLALHNSLLQSYYACLSGGSSGTAGSGCNEPCERDCETLDETLVDFKIDGWSVFTAIRANWFETKFIFHADVFGLEKTNLGVVQGFTKKMVTNSLSKDDLLNCSGVCEGKFQLRNFRIRPDWDKTTFGDQYKISWAEVDKGSTTLGVSIPLSAKFKVGPVEIGAGTTFSFSQTVGPVVELGSQNVFYCDPISMTHNTGSVTFRVN